jgi:hypothetical protein
MIKATIIFGTDAVRHYEETGEVPAPETFNDTGCLVVQKEFASQEHYDAYIEGLEDGDGFNAYTVVEREEAKEQPPNIYKFHQDEKVVVWQRNTFSVKAGSEEEAEAFIRENSMANSTDWHDDDFDGRVDFSGTEILFETQSEVSVEDNDGIPTIEIITPDRKSVADNCDNRHYLARSGQWRDRAIELIRKEFDAEDEKIAGFVDGYWANDTTDGENLFRFDVWRHGGDPVRERGERELCVFIFPLDDMDRFATDGEIVAAYESENNDDREYPVEKMTPDEFASQINDEMFADTQYWVRFIQY